MLGGDAKRRALARGSASGSQGVSAPMQGKRAVARRRRSPRLEASLLRRNRGSWALSVPGESVLVRGGDPRFRPPVLTLSVVQLVLRISMRMSPAIVEHSASFAVQPGTCSSAFRRSDFSLPAPCVVVVGAIVDAAEHE
jgi:hypothetical protein